VVLYGSVLAACLLAAQFPRSMHVEHLVACVCLAGFACTTYLGRHPSTENYSVASELHHPNIGRCGANANFRLCLSACAFPNVSSYGVNFLPPSLGRDANRLSSTGTLDLPSPRPGDCLVIEGRLPEQHRDPVRLIVLINGESFAEETVKPGPFSFNWSTGKLLETETCTIAVRTARCLDATVSTVAASQEGLAVRIEKVALLPAETGANRTLYLPSAEARRRTHFGRETSFHLKNDVPAVVQLPVLFYPGLLRVRDNGEPIPFGILDEEVAIRLPPGEHTVTVRFQGIRWANILGLIGWAGTGCLLLGGTLWSLRKPMSYVIPAVIVRKRLVGVTVLLGAFLLPLAWGVKETWAQRHPPGVCYHIVASSCIDSAHPVSQAFDGRPDTAWVPVTQERDLAALTIIPTRAASLEAMTFTPRFISLVEGWHKVEIVYYLQGSIVSRQEHVAPDAPRLRRWQPALIPVRTDRIDLFFTEPITETPCGDKLDKQQVRPSLAEVELFWR
jgi:hypothetical protein